MIDQTSFDIDQTTIGYGSRILAEQPFIPPPMFEKGPVIVTDKGSLFLFPKEVVPNLLSDISRYN